MEIRNFGINGATTGEVLAQELPKAEAFRPTLSILLVEANDSVRSTPAEFREDVREILSRLNAAGSRVIAMTPPFTDRAEKGRNPKAFQGATTPSECVAALEGIVREEAAAAGASLLDLHAGFAPTDLDAICGYIRNRRNGGGPDDGCLPTHEGYRRIAFLLFDRIRALHADTARIACLGGSITYGGGEDICGGGTTDRDANCYPAVLARLLAPNPARAKPLSDFAKKAVIYQISLRAFTQEGTLAAAEARLPDVARTGANIVYLLPIVEADPDGNREHWSKRQKGSGCDNPRNPYRISDYFRIDPEYGSDDDLRSFVAAAHALGMRVILDLVYFHAGPTFALRHPAFVRRGPDGTPIDGAWAFPQLDFSNSELREYLWRNMEHFVRNHGVDGYRCDVGDEVPLDFWEEGRRRVEAVKPDVFMLCEGNNRDDNTLRAFDACYFFPNAFLTAAALPGDVPAEAYGELMRDFAARFPAGARLLRNFDSHDIANDAFENRLERIYGPRAVDALLALCFLLDGIPFLYNGCEFHDTARHSIFAYKGQFTIDRSSPRDDRFALLARLAKARCAQKALHDGSTTFLHTNRPREILAFLREAEGERVLALVNLSPRRVRVAAGLDPAGDVLVAAFAERVGDEIEIDTYGFWAARLEEPQSPPKSARLDAK